MSIPNARCIIHDEIEPQNHDCQVDGLWVCPQCSHSASIKLVDGKKPIDAFFDKLEKIHNEIKQGKKCKMIVIDSLPIKGDDNE